MRKSTVTRLFVGGVVAVVAGLILAIAAGIGAYAGNVFVMNGPDVVDVRSSPFAWSMLALALVGVAAMVGGAVAGLVAWIGALLNTAQLDDKSWFVLLLVLGLLSFGFVAMLAYVLAGPDGTRSDSGHRRESALA